MILLRLKGGLGNQMFQYALGRVLALKHNVPLLFNIEAYLDDTPRIGKGHTMSPRNFQLDVFNTTGRIATKKEIPWLYRMYGKGRLMLIIDALRRRIFRHKAQELYARRFDSRFLSLGPDSYIDGFFQSPKYFALYEDVLRKDFTLRYQPQEHIQKLFDEIQSKESLCVHIRRGDFVNNKAHSVIDASYYDNALEILRKQIAIDMVYVFSDDIAWCKETLRFPYPTYFVGPEYVGEKDEGNMFLMSGCKNFIIPNSTFSWWAVWLSNNNNKKVVAPKVWSLDPQADMGDLVLDEWITL